MSNVPSQLPKIKVSYHRLSNQNNIPHIVCSYDAYSLFSSIWNQDTIELFEEFKVIYTDRKNAVIGYHDLCKGTSNGVLVNIKLILGIALECNADGIFLCHNHPSGQLKASEQDKQVTSKVKKACKLFDFRLHEHIIITKDGYLSMSNEGLL